MIKAIIFDFDGVILESADIKTKAFRELFAAYPKKNNAIVLYHLKNKGISRYVKFRYIYEQILNQDLSKDKEIELGIRFSQIVFQKILKAPFVVGAKEFLDKNNNRFQFFIASGTPEEELHKIVSAKGLGKYFKEIHGSPKKKTDIINDLVGRYSFVKNEVVYIGDAQSDRISAEEARIFFIERRTNTNPISNNNLLIIKDLSNLSKIIKIIEN